MSDDQDRLKDKQFSRREFLKLLGAGSLFLGLGAFGIPNILKNIREASAINQTAPPVLPGVMNNSNITSNDMNNLNNSDIRPFHVNVSEEELIELRRRINATRWPNRETVTDTLARRAARDDAETRTLLGDRLQLAQGRGETERPTAIHNRDRWARHSFHSRSVEA